MPRPTVNVAIVGAGPYGLSIAAHLAGQGVPHRIFGEPMSTWRKHMPIGMILKSDGIASNLYDGEGRYSLRAYCALNRIPYNDYDHNVSLETFCAYAQWFHAACAPQVENKQVIDVSRDGAGYCLTLDDGAELSAGAVIVAAGVTHFSYVPDEFQTLDAAIFSHSSQHRDVSGFRGKDVLIVGGGSSAIDLAALIHEAGANVSVIARRTRIEFHNRPGAPRSVAERILQPQSAFGPGWRSLFYAEAPDIFRRLPPTRRRSIVQNAFGPTVGFDVRARIEGKAPIFTQSVLQDVHERAGRVRAVVAGPEGRRDVSADHLIAATGYRVDLDRLGFLSPVVRAEVATEHGAPNLDRNFMSTSRGLHFVGLSAAATFGPAQRFAYGAKFAARRLLDAVTAGRLAAARSPKWRAVGAPLSSSESSPERLGAS